MSESSETRVVHVPAEAAGRRFDQVLTELFGDFSRSRLQQWIKEGAVTLDGQVARPRDKVYGGEAVALTVRLEEETRCTAQPIELDVRYRDESILVIHKPAGLVVHPAAGNPDGTLQNGLLHLDPALAAVPRAGIVHRLDKETSGLMVVARTLRAHKDLVEQLQARTVKRQYEAVVVGGFSGGGRVEAPIGRHPVDRKRMAVLPEGAAGAKPAVTHYRVTERFRGHTWLTLHLETGRTHQIRVHMAHLHHPLVGDPVYGGRLKLPAGCSEALKGVLRGFKRQALHAARLGLIHPRSGEAMEWVAELPADMVALIEALRADAGEHD
ncbi:23S rRNA pseudouridine(1911/1915/1917) synthase RluD [Endothiovibrio diazotrophicus]